MPNKEYEINVKKEDIEALLKIVDAFDEPRKEKQIDEIKHEG